MGSTYCSVTLIGDDLSRLEEVVEGRAFVAVVGDVSVVYAEGDDDVATSGEALSRVLACSAFSVSVQDSDMLMYSVHERGEKIMECMTPDFSDQLLEMGGDLGFDPLAHRPNPAALVTALGRGNVDSVEQALQDDFVFAEERHAALVAALGLPEGSAGWGYRYLAGDMADYEGPALVAINPV
jgi:hypothetical protein